MDEIPIALARLYELEDHVERGLGTVLHARGIPIFGAQGELLLTTPRVEIYCQVGAVQGKRAIFGNFLPFDTWHVTLIFRTVTARNLNADLHKKYRSQIRFLTQPFVGALTKVQLPWHVVAIANEAGTTRTVQDGEVQDISETHFAGLVSIRSDAWPVI